MFAVSAAQTHIAAASQSVLSPVDVLMCVTAGAGGSGGQHWGVVGLFSAVLCPGLVTSLRHRLPAAGCVCDWQQGFSSTQCTPVR